MASIAGKSCISCPHCLPLVPRPGEVDTDSAKASPPWPRRRRLDSSSDSVQRSRGFYKPDKRSKKEKAKARARAKTKAGQQTLFKEAMKTYCSAVGTASSEDDSRHLFESGDPAPGHPMPADEEAKARQQMRWKEAERVTPRGCEATKTAVGTGSGEAAARELLECGGRVLGYSIPFVLPDETLPRRGCNWLRLLPFPRRDPEPIRSMKALKAQHDAFLRRKTPQSQLRALNHKIMLQCLEWYNSKHPDDEYEPAPGVVTRRSDYDDNFLWTHGNFVARRKQSGWVPFLPAPRTLFFFELLDINATGVDKVITCTPIDEPVTEAYTFLGFPLGRGTRRHGGADCVCKTCYRQFHVPHIGLKRTCTCGDSKVESVCKMCYLNNSNVLHPIRGGFVFGQESYAKICR